MTTYDGVDHTGMTPAVVVRDPRSRMTRLFVRHEFANLEMPKLKVDEYYVGNPPDRELTIANLNDNIQTEFLHDMFAKFGKLEKVKIYTHPKTNKHLGIGRVVFIEVGASKAAFAALHQQPTMGNIIYLVKDSRGDHLKQMYDVAVENKLKFDPKTGKPDYSSIESISNMATGSTLDPRYSGSQDIYHTPSTVGMYAGKTPSSMGAMTPRYPPRTPMPAVDIIGKTPMPTPAPASRSPMYMGHSTPWIPTPPVPMPPPIPERVSLGLEAVRTLKPPHQDLPPPPPPKSSASTFQQRSLDDRINELLGKGSHVSQDEESESELSEAEPSPNLKTASPPPPPPPKKPSIDSSKASDTISSFLFAAQDSRPLSDNFHASRSLPLASASQPYIKSERFDVTDKGNTYPQVQSYRDPYYPNIDYLHRNHLSRPAQEPSRRKDMHEEIIGKTLTKLVKELEAVVIRDLNKRVVESVGFKSIDGWWEKNRPCAPLTLETDLLTVGGKENTEPNVTEPETLKPLLDLHSSLASLQNSDGGFLGLGFKSTFRMMPSFKIKKKLNVHENNNHSLSPHSKHSFLDKGTGNLKTDVSSEGVKRKMSNSDEGDAIVPSKRSQLSPSNEKVVVDEIYSDDDDSNSSTSVSEESELSESESTTAVDEAQKKISTSSQAMPKTEYSSTSSEEESASSESESEDENEGSNDVKVEQNGALPEQTQLLDEEKSRQIASEIGLLSSSDEENEQKEGETDIKDKVVPAQRRGRGRPPSAHLKSSPNSIPLLPIKLEENAVSPIEDKVLPTPPYQKQPPHLEKISSQETSPPRKRELTCKHTSSLTTTYEDYDDNDEYSASIAEKRSLRDSDIGTESSLGGEETIMFDHCYAAKQDGSAFYSDHCYTRINDQASSLTGALDNYLHKKSPTFDEKFDLSVPKQQTARISNKKSSSGPKPKKQRRSQLETLINEVYEVHARNKARLLSPEPQFEKRSSISEDELVLSILSRGIDQEDLNYLERAYEKLCAPQLNVSFVSKTHWVERSPTSFTNGLKMGTNKRKWSHDTFQDNDPNSTCQRCMPFVKKQSKTMRSYRKSSTHALLVRQADEFLPPSEIDAAAKQTQSALSREVRSHQRTLLSAFGDLMDNELIRFNALQLRKKKLTFSKSHIHNWGLFTLELIAADEMVIEYVGQRIRQIVADSREKQYEKMGIGSSYLFRLDADMVIDATRAGNLGRFINHSCTPNCYARVISVGDEKKIVIYSKRKIKPNEEITYDYKFPIEDDKIPCLCQSPQCRGTLN